MAPDIAKHEEAKRRSIWRSRVHALMPSVYILKSQKFIDKFYVGFTKNIEKRLNQHNTTPTCNQTSKYGPWEVVTYINFSEDTKAREFEKYLKTPSGKAFFRKHLI